MGTLFVDKLDPQSGTSLEIGSSGDTMTVPSGATLAIASGATVANSGTATGFASSVTPDNLQYFYLSGNATMSANAATTISGWGTPSLAADLIYNYGTQYVTHSSGIFSFSTEGYYHVAFRASGSTAGSSDSSGYINITTNNSAYSDAVDVNFSKSTGAGFNFYMDGIFKITDTSNHKLSTSIYAATNNITVGGNTTRLRTYLRFQRLGTAA